MQLSYNRGSIQVTQEGWMPVSRRSTTPVLALIGALAACDSGDAPAPTSASRADSAGVVLITHQSLEGVPLHAVGSEPDLVLGVIDGAGPEQFHRISAVRLRRSELFIADRGSGEIRVFGGDGHHVRTLGGSGQGPAEFHDLQTVLLAHGDTIIGIDARGPKLVKFAGDSLVETWVPGTPPDVTTPPRVLGRLASGGFLGMTVRPSPPSEGVSRPTVDILAYPEWGASPTKAAAFPGRERMNIPFGPALITQLLPFGRDTYVVAAGDQMGVVDPHRPEVRFYSRAGELEAIVRWIESGPAISPEAAVSEYIDSVVAATPEWGRPERRSMLEGLPLPERLPAVRSVFGTNDGDVWAELPGGAEGSEWLQVRPSGVRGKLALPAGLVLMDVSPTRVVALATDANGVERVRLHRLGGDM